MASVTKNRFWRARTRWSDNDRYFGPFLYSRDGKYKHTGVVLDSGSDEYPGCSLRVSGFGHTLIAALPPIIRPLRVQKAGYVDISEREFGFTYNHGHLYLKLGPQTMDSRTTKGWGCFLPWTQWRHVRHSLYGLNGEHVWTAPQEQKGQGFRTYEVLRAAKDRCPTRIFAFTDYDGERLTATTLIEEREWWFGTGWFKWLSLFRRPKVRRSLDIDFSGETGRKKGSWKGGVLGTGIDMLPGELHEAAFRRYCAKNEMTLQGLTDPTTPTGSPRSGRSS